MNQEINSAVEVKTATFQPLYLQIKNLLMERIASGEWPPGTYIPSEASLSSAYNVSIGTLRKALNELVTDNVVIRYQGKGTVVSSHDADSTLFRFFNITALDGERMMPVSRVLARHLRVASREEAAALDIAQGCKVLHIWRVRELGGVPVILEHISLDAATFPGLEREPETLPNTLYQLYQNKFSCTIVKASESIQAVNAGEDEVLHLEALEGEALLRISRVARDLQNKPVEFRVSTILTRNHTYINQL
ncbi:MULTISPECIES: GntR family transcriptional regulator [unclassified Raoultella]|uniref:GntR family transcriptional regulator n=1 Tax=unclassified Raoultella TaxID=2627600 RepID=UPI00135A069E|nr:MULTISPECIES: GntR family transcriptional regulator [unclassified Raoultella]